MLEARIVTTWTVHSVPLYWLSVPGTVKDWGGLVLRKHRVRRSSVCAELPRAASTREVLVHVGIWHCRWVLCILGGLGETVYFLDKKDESVERKGDLLSVLDNDR